MPATSSRGIRTSRRRSRTPRHRSDRRTGWPCGVRAARLAPRVVCRGAMKRTLVLVRHGETAWNREGRFQGHTDIALSDVGRAQARALRTRLETAHAYL